MLPSTKLGPKDTLIQKFSLEYLRQWYIMQLPGAPLGSSLKYKNSPPPKKFLIFQEMQLSVSCIKIFLETGTLKTNPCISKNGNPKNVSYISGSVIFQPKIEKKY